MWGDHLGRGQWSEMRFLYHFADSFRPSIAFKVGNCGGSPVLDGIVLRRRISTRQLLRASLGKETSTNTIRVAFRPVWLDLTSMGRLGCHVNYFRKVSLSLHFFVIGLLYLSSWIIALTERIRQSVMGGRIANVTSILRLMMMCSLVNSLSIVGVLVIQLGGRVRSILKFRFILRRQTNSANTMRVVPRTGIVTSANVRS